MHMGKLINLFGFSICPIQTLNKSGLKMKIISADKTSSTAEHKSNPPLRL